MRRIQAAPVNLNLPPGWVLPQGWQAYAMFALLPLFWLIGLSAIVWVLVAVAGASIAAVVQGVVKKMQDRVDPAPAVVNPAEVMGADRKPAPLPPPTR